MRVKAAVIGGGIVGCACLYALARRGWTDTVLLERLDLTHGSTWHAAGNVTHFGHDPAITRLYIDSLVLYTEAVTESGQPIGLHRTGSLRIATSEQELEAYAGLQPMYEALQTPYRIASPDEIATLHPLLDTTGMAGAAHTPADGHVDPSATTQALARAARDRGAAIKRFCPAEGIEQQGNGTWKIATPDGEVIADHVIVAASFWSRELLQGVGLDLPLYPLEHHEIITDAVPGLSADQEVPTVRDPYSNSNVRQEGQGFLIGVYEKNPVPWAVDGIPPDFGPELLPPDMARLEEQLMKVMERFPAIAEAGIKVVNNGPICFAPNALPMLGPVESHPGLWLATGFAVGIGTGGGSAQFLTDWIIDGKAPYDLPAVLPGRYPNPIPTDECIRQITETYARGYLTPGAK